MSNTSTRMRRYTSTESCEKIWKSFHSVLDKAWSESDDPCVRVCSISLLIGSHTSVVIRDAFRA